MAKSASVICNDPPPAVPSLRKKVWNDAAVVEFVTAWNSSTSVNQVAHRCGCSLSVCYNWFKKCVAAGIVMKSLSRSSVVNWSSVKSLLPDGSIQPKPASPPS